MSSTTNRILAAAGTALFSGVLARLQHGAEIERATDAMIAEAGRQIELQFESEDGRDIKTIGMMTVSLAAGAFVATGHPVWDSLYGLPLYFRRSSRSCYHSAPS